MRGAFHESYANFTEYINLGDVNKKLAKEIAILKNEQKAAFTKLKGHLVYIGDSLYTQQYQFLSAKVVNSTVNRRTNYLIINQGSEQEIQPDMGVIGPDGLVGIVKDVSAHYSSVFSLLHRKIQITAKIKKNNYFGIITWNEQDPTIISLQDIANHADISIGDTVVSRGASTVFPSNILIGTIDSFKSIKEDNTYEIKVKLSTDFNNLSYVYVVRNLLKDEQLQLESELKEEEVD